jgi:hypothetical protein
VLDAGRRGWRRLQSDSGELVAGCCPQLAVVDQGRGRRVVSALVEAMM